MQNKHQQMYIKNLKKHIPTGYPNTEQFVSSISQDIENYLEHHADADYDDICLEFGSPEELAASLTDEFTPSQINETFHTLSFGLLNLRRQLLRVQKQLEVLLPNL